MALADLPAARQPVPEPPDGPLRLPARLGIMGGTFDPIHYAHLFIAEQARERFDLPLVLFIPSAQPPHKLADPLTGAEHRLAMTRLAIADNHAFGASRMELDRPGPSYTIETIRELRAWGAAEPYLIVGADSVLEMASWYQHEAIFHESQVVAVAREGHDLSRLPEALGASLARRVEVLRVPLLDVSSTDIRLRLHQGRSIRYLTPDPVADYIRRNGLYQPCPGLAAGDEP